MSDVRFRVIHTPIRITNVGKDVFFQDIIEETNPAFSAIKLATLQEFLELISTFVDTLPICCRASTHTTCQFAIIIILLIISILCIHSSMFYQRYFDECFTNIQQKHQSTKR